MSSSDSIILAVADKPVPESLPEGSRRIVAGRERVLYGGYWVRTYPVPANRLEAKKHLIEALTRRLFKHTEYGLNVPGRRLAEARQSFEAETDPAKRRVKGAMLAGTLINRAADIFRHLVELEADGIEIASDNALMRECGRMLVEAMSLRQFVLHRSGEEGIDELWGEPFRAFSIPIEDYFESRYVKMSQAMGDIDRIADGIATHLGALPAFNGVAALATELAARARTKTETLRTDPDLFDVWSSLVVAGEHLVGFTPQAMPPTDNVADGLSLLRNGRDLIFYIARARTAMPKSTREFVERCQRYQATGKA